MWEIVPIVTSDLTCYQRCIASIANFYNRSYDMIFFDTWGIAYQWDRPFDLSKVKPRSRGVLRKNLKLFHGIQTVKCANNIDSCLQMLQMGPITTSFDTFYCPWHRGYEQYHDFTASIILGFDSSSRQFMCANPINTSERVWLAQENLTQNNGNLLCFSLVQQNRTSVWLLEELRNFIHFALEFRLSKSIYNIFDSLLQLNELSSIINFPDVSMSPLLYTFHTLACNLDNLAKTLMSMYITLCTPNEIATLSACLVRLAKNFFHLRLIVIKLAILKERFAGHYTCLIKKCNYEILQIEQILEQIINKL